MDQQDVFIIDGGKKSKIIYKVEIYGALARDNLQLLFDNLVQKNANMYFTSVQEVRGETFPINVAQGVMGLAPYTQKVDF